jgi:hypothetical protein
MTTSDCLSCIVTCLTSTCYDVMCWVCRAVSSCVTLFSLCIHKKNSCFCIRLHTKCIGSDSLPQPGLKLVLVGEVPDFDS